MKKTGARIAIVGPESTGKTVLAQKLAEYYRGIWVPEYARTYIEQLNRDYTYNDVKHIAEKVVESYNKHLNTIKPVFFDTEMIINKVWFDKVYGKHPVEMTGWLKKLDFDAFLLLYPDLPWKPDLVRENGGEMRNILFEQYKQEIINLHKPYGVVSGEGEARTFNAIRTLSSIANIPKSSEKS